MGCVHMKRQTDRNNIKQTNVYYILLITYINNRILKIINN